MNKRVAQKLQNRDKVQICIDLDKWVDGIILGDPVTTPDGRNVFVNVQTKTGLYVGNVHHTAIK